ncbi:MAG: cupin domain-containing protein [Gaiellaceae bacterium]
MVPEAPLEDTPAGRIPAGEGWYVLNARDARWSVGGLGAFCNFEGEPRFDQLGINLNIVQPGVSMTMYHWESDQEDFLILSGEALLIVEGEERPLKQWDFVHCPRGTSHAIVGAGDRPAVVLAVGARTAGEDRGAYVADEAALRHGAGVEQETTSSKEAYARFDPDEPTRYQEGWLPG